ncbi:MAG: 4-hydroxy-2-oxo-heptane-1,7-dioate aldolase [Planctomycetes bacterium ADurb.Bin401]|nr:MAG: 4-hydroxy-2-oxo-heptane-1,7-dioate aldolase [Planctomycetes bacterium ADurb.Bin401]
MNKLKKALLNNEVTFGTWIQIGHRAVAEILARQDFDWICVDLEHGVIDLETTAELFAIIESLGKVPVARIPLNDPIWIHRVLDAGAQGLIIPMIKNALQAQSAVEESKYPPFGSRGFGYSRANGYGINFHQYIKEANNEISIILQIEHIDAINELDSILKVDGFDATFIGPLDLAGSMKTVDDLNNPTFLNALEKYRSVSAKLSKTTGMHIVRPNGQNIAKTLSEGYKMIALGLDTVFIEEKAKELLKFSSC